MHTRQQAQFIMGINPVDLSVTKKVPLVADANELLNGGANIA
jgi:hypothetical protein